MQIRNYDPSDCDELRQLFYNTIHTVNSADYTLDQRNAWAPADYDRGKWRSRMDGINPLICVDNGTIIGYAGLLPSGYIDHFYIHHSWQRRGVGKLLYTRIESVVISLQLRKLTVDVSITARPFFEAQGFSVVTPQEVSVLGVTLKNYAMSKELPTQT